MQLACWCVSSGPINSHPVPMVLLIYLSVSQGQQLDQLQELSTQALSRSLLSLSLSPSLSASLWVCLPPLHLYVSLSVSHSTLCSPSLSLSLLSSAEWQRERSRPTASLTANSLIIRSGSIHRCLSIIGLLSLSSVSLGRSVFQTSFSLSLSLSLSLFLSLSLSLSLPLFLKLRDGTLVPFFLSSLSFGFILY